MQDFESVHLSSIRHMFNQPLAQAACAVCTQNDLEPVFALRERCFGEEKNYLLNLKQGGHPGEDDIDPHSIIYRMDLGPACIGSARITSIEDYGLPHFSSFQAEDTAVFSRICIEKEYRQQNLHVLMFYEFSNWLLTHTAYRNYISLCTAPEYRLYHSLGARRTAIGKFKLYPNQAENYIVVRGSISEFNQMCQETLLIK